MIDVNLSGVWKTVKAGVPHLLAGGRGGSIILTSSVGGLKAYPHTGHYVAAKHGVVGPDADLRRRARRAVHPRQLRASDPREHAAVDERATFRMFRPDLENPGPDDMAPVCQSFHILPIPWVNPTTSATRCCSWPPTRPATSPALRFPSTPAAA